MWMASAHLAVSGMLICQGREWVLGQHAHVPLSRVQIFSPKQITTELYCATQNHGVPKRNSITRLDFDRGLNIAHTGAVDTPLAKVHKDFRRLIRSQRDTDFLRHCDIEFLQHLNTETSKFFVPESGYVLPGDLMLGPRRSIKRVHEYVCVDELIDSAIAHEVTLDPIRYAPWCPFPTLLPVMPVGAALPPYTGPRARQPRLRVRS